MKISRLFLPFLIAIAGCIYTPCGPVSIFNSTSSEDERMMSKKYALSQLKSNVEGERAESVLKLVSLRAKENSIDIAWLLIDKSNFVRRTAVLALGDLDAKEYAECIERRLNDEDEDVRQTAEKVLKKWGYDVEKLKEKK